MPLFGAYLNIVNILHWYTIIYTYWVYIAPKYFRQLLFSISYPYVQKVSYSCYPSYQLFRMWFYLIMKKRVLIFINIIFIAAIIIDFVRLRVNEAFYFIIEWSLYGICSVLIYPHAIVIFRTGVLKTVTFFSFFLILYKYIVTVKKAKN